MQAERAEVARLAASAKQLQAKTVLINEHTAFRANGMPFGGYNVELGTIIIESGTPRLIPCTITLPSRSISLAWLG